MSVTTSESQQTTRTASATINGEKRTVASATVTIRPGRSMQVSVDWLESRDNVPEDDRAQIAAVFGDYLGEEMMKAAEAGVPVVRPVGLE